jgi:hypothetical protein
MTLITFRQSGLGLAAAASKFKGGAAPTAHDERASVQPAFAGSFISGFQSIKSSRLVKNFPADPHFPLSRLQRHQPAAQGQVHARPERTGATVATDTGAPGGRQPSNAGLAPTRQTQISDQIGGGLLAMSTENTEFQFRELTLIYRLVEQIRRNSISTDELSHQLPSPDSRALPPTDGSEPWEKLPEKIVFCMERHAKEPEPFGGPRCRVPFQYDSSPRMHPVGWKFKKGRGFNRMLVFRCPRCGRCCGLTLHHGRVVPVFQHGQIKIY